jgi:predicted hotdog family 3-hydroxylacyl-ACP dehydratase
MIAKPDWQHLIPHRDAMALLDTIVEFGDTTIHAIAVSHRDPHNPLRSDGVLRAVNLCEYGAQAMAIHGGLLAQRDGSVAAPGFLVSLRAIELHVARIDDLPHDLHVYATQLHGDSTGWQYEFRIAHDGALLAAGRAAVMTRPQA